MKKNDTYTGIAEGYTEDGSAVVRIAGVVIFVPGLIVGEEAEIAINKMKKNYGYGRVVRILKPSEHRVEPVCSVHRLCGGCQLQHMDEEAQKDFKEEKVRGCFAQNAGMDIRPLPILDGGQHWNYRNKVQVPVQVNQGRVDMGFYQNHTNRVIPYDVCHVQNALSNRISRFFQNTLDRLSCASDVRHILIKHAHRTGEVMVCMIVRKYPFNNADVLQEKLLKEFPQIRSFSVIVNNNNNNVILDGKEILLAGRSYIEEELLGCRFRISARSFYQINPYATEVLYKTALEYAQLTGNETVIDLYCGTGTIGILASKQAKKVYGIEIVADAVRDARINAEINNAGNIEFVNTDASKGAQAVLRSKIRPDVVIVDPPRKGCSADTLDAIEKMNPERLVYVSCDPATLARDVKIMREKGYEVEKIQPVDMFPNTNAVETVVLFCRKPDGQTGISQ